MLHGRGSATGPTALDAASAERCATLHTPAHGEHRGKVPGSWHLHWNAKLCRAPARAPHMGVRLCV
eukprot:7391772-Prymnesium_polylepis.1